jgi:AcrR family transcriptional regulator
MSPRAYTMARRAETVASTRDAILAAAAEVYRQRGIAGTTTKDIALRAGVSRATVLNHFGSREDVARAVVAGVTASLKVPDEGIFAGARSRADRVRRLVAALFEFYERSAPWYELFRGELGAVPALKEGEQRFWADVQALYTAALGNRASDRKLYATVVGLTNPSTLDALRQSGLTLSEASVTIGDVLAGLVARR